MTNNSRRRAPFSAGLIAAISALTGLSTSAVAQTNPPPPDSPKPAVSRTVTGDPQVPTPVKNADAAKPVEFAEVGQAISTPTVKIPEGATEIRQMSAPLANGKDNLLLNVYKVNGDLFADLFTSHDSQAWTKQNHVRLKTPITIRPAKMTVTMRYMEPMAKRGYLVALTDELEILALVFPTGFGGKVSQQSFLTQSKAGTRHSYAFGDQDSRGFTLVRVSLESAGSVNPSSDVQFYVWNGRSFIPRKEN